MPGYSRLIAAGALLLLAAPANAATSVERGNGWLAIAEPCRAMMVDAARNPDTLLATCRQGLATLETAFADPARTPQDDTEANFYWLAVMGAHTGIGAGYADIDKARSRRVCESIVAQDLAAARFKREAWPVQWREPVDRMLEAAQAPRTKCRNEFGI